VRPIAGKFALDKAPGIWLMTHLYQKEKEPQRIIDIHDLYNWNIFLDIRFSSHLKLNTNYYKQKILKLEREEVMYSLTPNSRGG
jgi:hypothetical protein